MQEITSGTLTRERSENFERSDMSVVPYDPGRSIYNQFSRSEAILDQHKRSVHLAVLVIGFVCSICRRVCEPKQQQGSGSRYQQNNSRPRHRQEVEDMDFAESW